MRARPLSPHLFTYRFGYTMALSFLHRATGLFLAAGLTVLVWWLMAAAAGRSSYDDATVVLSHWVFKLLLLGWLASFIYHFCNGIRHLFWDMGKGLERAEARRSGAIVVIATLLLWGWFAWQLFMKGTAP